jgi:FAD/FMN-containing dehydrogenase
MTTIGSPAVASLRSRLSGTLLVPDDADFGAARAAAIWNGDITRQPAAIVRVHTTEDVVAVVGWARAEGLDLTVRGGGHAFAGHAVADGAVMVDLSAMNAVIVDAGARRARCGGGSTWGDVDAVTAEHGLAVTGGFISHTGVAGLALGGGFGWLTRQCGMTCDNLVSAQVVTADGRVVTASATENPDLHWALRGGGGNFGIVTEFEFALHPMSPMANLGMFVWAPQDAREVLQFARTYLHDVPRDVGGLIAGMTAPPAPFVPEQFHGATGIAVLLASFGNPDEHDDIVAPLRRLKPAFEFVTPIPYVAMQQMQNDSAPWGAHAYEKALYLDDLTDEVIDLTIDYLSRKTSPLSFVPIFPLGGAYADVRDDATAFGGSRTSRWVFNISGTGLDAETLVTERQWVREFWDALRPLATSDAGYVNFLAEEDHARVRASYGAKYDRLAAVKAVWDPDNVFHHNANVRPAGVVPRGRAAPTARTSPRRCTELSSARMRIVLI